MSFSICAKILTYKTQDIIIRYPENCLNCIHFSFKKAGIQTHTQSSSTWREINWPIPPGLYKQCNLEIALLLIGWKHVCNVQ